jgi:ppGpp synthetase/RelA/SpoT-type nucleotidyltranferase
MIIPESVQMAYERELEVITPLRGNASSRLRLVAADNDWLFDDRVKSAESVLSKLDSGYPALSSMHDFYAAMLVVPTQKDIGKAVNAVQRSLNARVKPSKLSDVSSFAYDDVHMIAKLRGKVSPAAVTHAVVLDREFEVQIHTGVQYAWWRATHDSLYKDTGSSGATWEAKRASGQARAALEMIDGILSDFHAAGRLQPMRPMPSGDVPVALGWADYWSKRQRPDDRIRFSGSALAIIGACGIDPADVSGLLAAGALQSYVDDKALTPVQVILIACHILGGDAIFAALASIEHKVLVTSELVSAYAACDAVAVEDRVSI